ncbi:hypothetical protein ACWC3X_40505 [Streptomyces populi]|jgi:hypothetical protein
MKQALGRTTPKIRHADTADLWRLLPGVMVAAAGTGDRTAAQVLLGQVADVHHRLELVRADGGCTGSLVEHCPTTLTPAPAIVRHSDDMHGFVVPPEWWIVDRLFTHLTRSRRLVRASLSKRGWMTGSVDQPAQPPQPLTEKEDTALS